MMVQTETWAFLFFGSLVFIGLYIKLAHYKKKALHDFMRLQFLPSHFFTQNWLAFATKATCLIASFSLLSIFQAHPVLREKKIVKEVKVSTKPKIDEVLFLLDSSTSMLAKDTSRGVARLDRAKEIIESVIENLGGINVSLITFTGSAETVVPPTEDYLYFRILLDALRPNESGATGTNLLSLVEYVQKKEEAHAFAKSELAVFLTDGEDTGFLDLSKGALEEAQESLLKKVEDTVPYSLTWTVIGLGSTSGSEVPGILSNGKPVVSKMQKELLLQIAQAGKGRFYDESEMPLLSIIDNLLADIAVLGVSGIDVSSETVVLEENMMPLLAAFILILAALLLPQGRKI